MRERNDLFRKKKQLPGTIQTAPPKQSPLIGRGVNPENLCILSQLLLRACATSFEARVLDR